MPAASVVKAALPFETGVKKAIVDSGGLLARSGKVRTQPAGPRCRSSAELVLAPPSYAQTAARQGATTLMHTTAP